ncbi:DUF397 domain-containing protein [Streptomyces sp. NPDC093586]
MEVADGVPSLVPVRDSKRPYGPVVAFRASAWVAFLGELKAGRHRP